MRRRGDEGSVVVEFIGLGVLLMAPLVYVLVVLSQFQAASLAAVTIADEASRIQAESPDAATAEQRRALAVREMAEGHGLDPADIRVTIECDTACPGHGAHARAVVEISVSLPLMPAEGARVGIVRSSATQYTPRYG